jgi:hypothetical protein
MPLKKQDNKAETQSERAPTELIWLERSIFFQNQLLILSDAIISQIAELVRAIILQSVTDTLKFFISPELNARNISTMNDPPLNPFSLNSSNELSYSNFPNLPFSNTAAIYTLQLSIKTSNIGYFYPNMLSS